MCNNRKSDQKLSICTLCGSISHDWTKCYRITTTINSKQVHKSISSNVVDILQSNEIKCMSCEKYGHIMCKLVPGLTNECVFTCFFLLSM